MALNTEQLQRCILTLDRSYESLVKCESDTIDYEVFRNATVKAFELTLEISGKLLRKALRPYFSAAKAVDALVFKDLFRYGAKHGFIGVDEVERWIKYRDNRNSTAHDYGIGFAEETMALLPAFCADAKQLLEVLRRAS